MDKTRKCYRYFIALSIFMGILFVIVFIRIHSMFLIPDEEKLMNFLLNFQYPLLLCFVVSTSITIALKSILSDLEYEIANLKVEVKYYKNRILELEKNK